MDSVVAVMQSNEIREFRDLDFQNLIKILVTLCVMNYIYLLYVKFYCKRLRLSTLMINCFYYYYYYYYTSWSIETILTCCY
jgi:hypothetical protein